MATAPFRKCMSTVAGTPVIDSPITRVATSSVPLVTLTRTAFRWYFSIARLAAAATSSAADPCLGVEPFWPTVVLLVEPPEGSPEPEAPSLACSLPPQPGPSKPQQHPYPSTSRPVCGIWCHRQVSGPEYQGEGLLERPRRTASLPQCRGLLGRVRARRGRGRGLPL